MGIMFVGFLWVPVFFEQKPETIVGLPEYGRVDTNMRRFLDELFALILQPAISATGEGISQCAEPLARTMGQAEIETEVVERKPFPFICGQVPGRPGGRTLLF